MEVGLPGVFALASLIVFWAFIFYRRTEFGSVTEFHLPNGTQSTGGRIPELGRIWQDQFRDAGVAGVLDRLLDEEFRKQTKMK